MNHDARKIRANGSQVPRGLRNMSKLRSMNGATMQKSSATTTTRNVAAVLSGGQ
jgi:hypothetical protein